MCGCPSDPVDAERADLEVADTDADLDVADTHATDTLDTGTDASPDLGPDATAPDAPDTVADVPDTVADASDVVSSAPAMRLHVLDVGQGEAIIVELPCGAMLVDTGGEVTAATGESEGFDSVEALEAQVRAFFTARPDLNATFDLVVLTHPHIDHTRGVTRLLEMVAGGELTIKNVVTNGAEGSGLGLREQRALHDHADASSGVGRWYVLQRKTGATGLVNTTIDPFGVCAREGGEIDPQVTALWGRIDDASEHATTWPDDDLDNDNNHSVVLRVDFGAASVLLTGDLEDVAIGALVAQYAGTGLLDVDVYKAGHHGSHNGTTAAHVNAMTPRAAVISAGPAARVGDWTAWDHGHPRWPAVSDLLGDGDSVGVSADRPTSIDALVAVDYADGHGVFAPRTIAPAVYCTGWEGEGVVITLRADGTVELPN